MGKKPLGEQRGLGGFTAVGDGQAGGAGAPAAKHILLATGFCQDGLLQIRVTGYKHSFQRIFGGWCLACRVPTGNALQLEFALSHAAFH